MHKIQEQLTQIKWVESEKAKLNTVIENLDIICHELSLQNPNIDGICKNNSAIRSIIEQASYFQKMFNTKLLYVCEYLRACAGKQLLILNKKKSEASETAIELLKNV